MQRRLPPLASTTLAGLLALILVAGCGHENGTSPVAAPAASTDGPLKLLLNGQSPRLGLALGAESDTVMKAIGSDGGTLKLDAPSYTIKVAFPKGAVAQTANVTLALVDGEHAQFLVSPADLVLLKPVTVTVQKLDHATRRDHASVGLFIMESGSWRPLGLPGTGNDLSATSLRLGQFGVQALTADGQPLELLRWLSGPGYATALVKASEGGKVEYGRYKITIPKLALAADTWITVRDPGSPYLLCQLEPEGTVFSVPAQLTMNCDGLDTDPFTNWSIWYFNPSTSAWEDQGGSFDGHQIQADLHHFSTYAGGRLGCGGRAGW